MRVLRIYELTLSATQVISGREGSAASFRGLEAGQLASARMDDGVDDTLAAPDVRAGAWSVDAVAPPST